jgi:uncharacterized protein
MVMKPQGRVRTKIISPRYYFLMVFACAYTYTLNLADTKSLSLLTEKPALFTQEHLNKQKKYLNGGLLQYITFTAQQEEDSAKKALQRNGILFIKPDARATILICHGFMCDKFDIGFLRRTVFPHYNVMVFDFRAHGENVDEEQCCTFGRDEAFDVIGAVNYLKSRDDIKHLPRIAYGFSMGAAAAIAAQAKDPSLFEALILDCPYDATDTVIKRSLDKLTFSLFGYSFEIPGKTLLAKFAYNSFVQSCIKMLLKTVASIDVMKTNTQIYPFSPAEAVKNIYAPCFFIQCKNDEKVPVKSAKLLFNNAQGYKRLWITEGRRHYDSIFYNPDKYMYKVNAFIMTVLNGDTMVKCQQKILGDDHV